MKTYTNFEMNHIVENEEPSEKCRWYIDGFTDDDNDVGTVIATVVLTAHDDIITNWHQNGYRLNQTVLKLINDAKMFANEKINDPTYCVGQFNTFDELSESLKEHVSYDEQEYNAIGKFTEPDFSKAVLGITHDNRIVYDYETMIRTLMADDNMTYEEAIEFIDYNTIKTIPYMGAQHPMVLHKLL